MDGAYVKIFAGLILVLSGCVKESLGKTDLTSAYVVTYDSVGNVSDSIKCDKGGKYYMG